MVPRFVTFRRPIVLGLIVLCSPLIGSATEPVRPLRQLELVTGELLIVEFLRLDEHGCEFRWHGDTRCRLPLAAIRSLANPPGVIDHFDESFDAMSRDGVGRRAWHSHRNPTWQHTVDVSITAGELRLWCRVDDQSAGESAKVAVCHYRAAEQNADLVLTMHADGSFSCDASPQWRKTFTQPLRTVADWQCVSIRWNPGRCEIAVGDAVHTIFATDDEATFTALTLESGAAAAAVGVGIDDVVLREFRTEMTQATASSRVEDQDAVTLTTGDQLFGRTATSARPGHIALHGPQGDWSGTMSDTIRLDFARRPLPAHFQMPVRGWCFDVRTSAQDAPYGLTESLRGVRFTPRTVLHPWLGEMAWSPSQRDVITPHGWGEFRWLEPDRRHLGDEIRPDLSPAVPVGTSLGGEVTLDDQPTGRTWIVLDIAELEPSGSRTLPTQPFLETLRGGGLRTELMINGKIATDLNRYVSIRTDPQHPQRVWLPIPHTLWHAGKNTWVIRQRPLSPTQTQYDDAEVGRIGLWINPW